MLNDVDAGINIIGRKSAGIFPKPSVRRASARKGIVARLARLLPPKPLNKKIKGLAQSGWRSSTLVFLWAGGNVKRDQGNELRHTLLSQVRMHTKRQLKATHSNAWVAFGCIPKFKRGRL